MANLYEVLEYLLKETVIRQIKTALPVSIIKSDHARIYFHVTLLTVLYILTHVKEQGTILMFE